MTKNIENKMFPYCRILYKTDNSAGWYMGTMGVDEDIAKEYCEKQKNKGLWYDYKCYLAGKRVFQLDPNFSRCKPSAYDMHLLTDLIYNSYEDKWFYPDEIMPLPKTDAKLCKDFYLDIVPLDLTSDGCPLWDKNDFENVAASIRFLPCKYKFNIQVDLLDVPDFIKRLKKYGYAEMTVEEYTFCKLLAWKVEGNILFILQYYGEDEVEECLKILVSEQEFYAEFIKLEESIKYLSARLATLYAEFKSIELFLHGMRWVYDVNNPKCPQEYTMLSWNDGRTLKWKKFVKKIKKERMSDKTLNFGKYKYWVDDKEERLSRTYAYQHEEDLIRFVKSSDFNYQEGMTLQEVYQQLVSRGYQYCIEGEWENQKIIIYASGDVITKNKGNHVPELENLVKKVVRDAHAKPTISTDKLQELLRKAGFGATSWHGHRNMNIKNL